MKKGIIQFIIFALIGLGIGYLVFDVIKDDSSTEPVASTSENSEETSEKAAEKEESPEKETTEEASANAESVLKAKGCIGCHSVEGLNLQGGTTGPDLTNVVGQIEGKHGKPLEEFLKEPTTTVMAGVIEGSPLTDEEISQIVEELKQAAESN